MRSFEIAAIGGCLLAEDTLEHRDLFGPDGSAAVYFGSPDQMLDRLRWLLAHDGERARLAAAARQVVVSGRHTYQDRLATMLGLTGGEPCR
jgi:spore maturation protein CgeB